MHPVTLCCLSFMEAYYVDMRTCRLFPITFATSRRIAKDIELFGYHIPAGVTVFVVFHSSLYVFFYFTAVSDKRIGPQTNAQNIPPTPRRLSCRVASRRAVCIEFATEFTTIWLKKMKTEHVENLSSRVDCRIGNWFTTADG